MEFTPPIGGPGCASAESTSAAVRASAMPARVSSSRIGITIISGYICSLPWLHEKLGHAKTWLRGKSFSLDSTGSLGTLPPPLPGNVCKVFKDKSLRSGLLVRHWDTRDPGTHRTYVNSIIKVYQPCQWFGEQFILEIA